MRDRNQPGTERARALACLAAAALGAFAACRAPALPARPNVVVVLVDTLRADRLSLYGYGRETSPALDRFAAERGVVFTNALANAGCTYPSAHSLLTGVWPQRFVADFETHGMTIPPELSSLAERFTTAGYDTAAVSASSVVRKTPSKYNLLGGFGRGFASFDESCLKSSAACVHARAIERLDALAEPYFLYLHYLEPHSPYRPPRGAARTFSAPSRKKARDWARLGTPWVIQRQLYGHDDRASFTADDVRHLADLYDDEVRYFDARFGELLGEIERRGQLERTVVAFVSDHGEELFDNGHWAHCRDLAFDTLLATPLMIAVPGLDPNRRDEAVSNVDLAPTLLELAGVPFDPADFDGRSLASAVVASSHRLPPRFAFAAQGSSRVASDGKRMVRINLRDGKSQISPLARGQRAAASVDPADPEVIVLRRALLEWIRKHDRAANEGESVRQADRIEQQLKALGYL